MNNEVETSRSFGPIVCPHLRRHFLAVYQSICERILAADDFKGCNHFKMWHRKMYLLKPAAASQHFYSHDKCHTSAVVFLRHMCF